MTNVQLQVIDCNSNPYASKKLTFTPVNAPIYSGSKSATKELVQFTCNVSGAISQSMVESRYQVDLGKSDPATRFYLNVSESGSALVSSSFVTITGSRQTVFFEWIDSDRDAHTSASVTLTPFRNYPALFSGSIMALYATSSKTDGTGYCEFTGMVPGIYSVLCAGKIFTGEYISVPGFASTSSTAPKWNANELIVSATPNKGIKIKINAGDSSYYLTVSASDARYVHAGESSTNTASFAFNAFSANSASFASSSFSAASASWASRSFSATSASYASESRYATSASFASSSLTSTSASFASRSLATTSASFSSASLTATSSSWASASVSASYSPTSSYSVYAETASFIKANRFGNNTLTGSSLQTDKLVNGQSCFAPAPFTLASGTGNVANQTASVAFGVECVASALYSFVQGNSCESSGEASHAEGNGTTSPGIGSHSEGVGATATGWYSHGEGSSTHANGVGSHAEGSNTNAQGDFSHAEGYLTLASASNSHAEGTGTTAVAPFSHAEGNGTIANATGSHAEGSNTISVGDYSHAEGEATTASGSSAHAEGLGTIAKADYSHAEGDASQALGNYSHAEGGETIATNYAAHSEGFQTTASGQFSHAGGLGTVACADGQTTIGQFNVANSSSYLIIGNGSGSSNRSDVAQFNSQSIIFSQSLTLNSASSVIAPRFMSTNAGTATAPVFTWFSETGSGFCLSAPSQIGHVFNGSIRLNESSVAGGGLFSVSTTGAAGAFGMGVSSTSPDTFITRAGVGVVAIRNGVNTCGFEVYNTYTSDVSSSKGLFSWANNILLIGNQATGSLQVPRETRFTGSLLAFATSGSVRWIINPAGHLVSSGSNALDIGSTGSNKPRIIYAGTSVISTGDVQAGTDLTLGATGKIQWAASTRLTSPSDGVVVFTDSGLTSFNRLCFAGATSGDVSLKKSAVGLQARNGDDTAFTTFEAGTLICSGSVTSGPLTMLSGSVLNINSGTNQRAGNTTLVGGTKAVSNTSVTANTIVMLSRKTIGGTAGNLSYTVSAGTSFTINSSSGTDTSVVSYLLVEVP